MGSKREDATSLNRVQSEMLIFERLDIWCTQGP